MSTSPATQAALDSLATTVNGLQANLAGALAKIAELTATNDLRQHLLDVSTAAASQADQENAAAIAALEAKLTPTPVQPAPPVTVIPEPPVEPNPPDDQPHPDHPVSTHG